MRLKEIKYIIDFIDTESSFLKFENSGTTGYNVSNIDNFKKFIDVANHLPFFKEEVDAILQSAIYTTNQNFIFVGNEQTKKISSTSNYLVRAVEALDKVLPKVLPEEKKDSVNIKLPCPNDLESLVNDLKLFEKCINQVICNDTINGHLKVNSWESGSFWVELIVGTQAAVALIAGVSWSAAVISKKIKEGTILEQQIRSLEIKNESLEDILEKQKQATNILIEKEVRHLQVKHFNSDEDNEQFERLKLTTKTFAELIQNGAEIHPALSAPEQIQNVFPNYKNIEAITSQIKLLKESTE